MKTEKTKPCSRIRSAAVWLTLILALAVMSGTVNVYAANNATGYVKKTGPCNVKDKFDNCWISMIGAGIPEGTNKQFVFTALQGKPFIPNDFFTGIKYDLASNTLTMDHFVHPEWTLNAHAMGDDLTIEVVGDCALSQISIFGYEMPEEPTEPQYWGGSLNITGTGKLVVNKAKTLENGIELWADGSDATLKISKTVSLEVYGTEHAIFVCRSAGFYDSQVVFVDGKNITTVYPKYVMDGFMNEAVPTLKDYWVKGTEVVIGGSGGLNIEGAAVVLSASTMSFNGKVQKPTIVSIGGHRLKEGVDYTAVYETEMSAAPGTYTITITGKGACRGSTKAAYKIKKAANPLSFKAATTKTVTVKYSKVKKKAQTLAASKLFTFKKKGKGTVTFTKVSGSKKITINKKTGKVTLKKGIKKGTYKLKVKVKAAGNAYYKAASKTITLKLRVK